MVSTECVVCPHCKARNNKYLILGMTGLVSVMGQERELTCLSCNKGFKCECEVKLKFYTRKENDLTKPTNGRVYAITTLPADDGNFKCILQNHVTDVELDEAIEFLKENPKGNKSRLVACEREKKRRAK